MRAALKMTGKSFRSIASELGFGESTITAAFKHENPSAALLLAVSRFAGVSADWLLTGAGDWHAPRQAHPPPIEPFEPLLTTRRTIKN